MDSAFDSYRITYYTAPLSKYQVMLDLYFGSYFVGRVLFMKKSQPIPANVIQNEKPLLHYSIDDFNNILLILALDKPLYVSLNTSNGIGAISTSNEAIGDLDKS
jgi:hypothetical protein